MVLVTLKNNIGNMEKKELKINLEELTRAKHRSLDKFCEKEKGGLNIKGLNYNSQTKLTQLWVNLHYGYGNCWLPLDGCLTEEELNKIKAAKITKCHDNYTVILSFKGAVKKICREKAVSVASQSMRFKSLEVKYSEVPEEIQKIKGKIPRSRVYKILHGKYSGCYAIKMFGYWSPPVFRTSFDCGVYDKEGILIGI